MILKIYTSTHWWYIDNISQVYTSMHTPTETPAYITHNLVINFAEKSTPISIHIFRQGGEEMWILLNTVAYLLNNNGKTIETLYDNPNLP